MINYDAEEIDVQKKENMVRGNEEWNFLINRICTVKILFLWHNCIKYRVGKSYVCMISACYKLLEKNMFCKKLYNVYAIDILRTN